MKSWNFANLSIFYEITSDLVHTAEKSTCVIAHLHVMKTTVEGILLTGSVADILVRNPLPFLLNKSVTPIWQKTSFFICAIIRKFALILNQWNWIDSGEILVKHISFWSSDLVKFYSRLSQSASASRGYSMLFYIKNKARHKVKTEFEMRVTL
jgi:hypothetical protein